MLNLKSDPITNMTVEMLTGTGTFIAALWAEQFPREFIQQVEVVRAKINLIFANMLPVHRTSQDLVIDASDIPQRLRIVAEDLYVLTDMITQTSSLPQAQHTHKIAGEIQAYLHPILFAESSPLVLPQHQRDSIQC